MSDDEARDIHMTASRQREDGTTAETEVIVDRETGENVQLGDELGTDANAFLDLMKQAQRETEGE